MRMHGGFTLIELLVVIAILAVLAVVVVLTLNPAGMLQEARDSNRLSDLATITSGIATFVADVPNPAAILCSANTVYVSVPDPTATSTARQPVPRPRLAGAAFRMGLPVRRRLDHQDDHGTGWVPINFSQSGLGSPFPQLPQDPINRPPQPASIIPTSPGNNGQYEVTSLFESAKFKTQFGPIP